MEGYLSINLNDLLVKLFAENDAKKIDVVCYLITNTNLLLCNINRYIFPASYALHYRPKAIIRRLSKPVKKMYGNNKEQLQVKQIYNTYDRHRWVHPFWESFRNE